MRILSRPQFLSQRDIEIRPADFRKIARQEMLVSNKMRRRRWSNPNPMKRHEKAWNLLLECIPKTHNNFLQYLFWTFCRWSLCNICASHRYTYTHIPTHILAKYFKYLLLPTAKRRLHFQATKSSQRKTSTEETSFLFQVPHIENHTYGLCIPSLTQGTIYMQLKEYKYQFINTMKLLFSIILRIYDTEFVTTKVCHYYQNLSLPVTRERNRFFLKSSAQKINPWSLLLTWRS